MNKNIYKYKKMYLLLTLITIFFNACSSNVGLSGDIPLSNGNTGSSSVYVDPNGQSQGSFNIGGLTINTSN